LPSWKWCAPFRYLSLGDDQYAKMHVVWGMKGLDDSDYNPYDPPCCCTKASGCAGWKYSKPTCRGTVKYAQQQQQQWHEQHQQRTPPKQHPEQ